MIIVFDFGEQLVWQHMGRCPICGEWVTVSDISSMEDTVWRMDVRVAHANLRYTQCHAFMLALGKEQQELIQNRVQQMHEQFTRYL